MVDAAPAAVFRKRRLGGPWVTVRAHYGALPSVAGRDRRRVGESLPGCELARGLRPEEPVPGSKKSLRWSVRKALFYYQGASFGAPSPLKKGRSTKSLNSRGGARTKRPGCLKFESRNFG